MDGPRTQPRKTERELFLEALERPTPGKRTAFLDEACAHEPPLRAAVEALLQHHKEDGFLESSAIVVPVWLHAVKTISVWRPPWSSVNDPGTRLEVTDCWNSAV